LICDEIEATLKDPSKAEDLKDVIPELLEELEAE